LIVTLPQLFLLNVSNPVSIGRQTELKGRWTLCNPDSLLSFSAIGGWFGRNLHREFYVPIGIITSARSGIRFQGLAII